MSTSNGRITGEPYLVTMDLKPWVLSENGFRITRESGYGSRKIL